MSHGTFVTTVNCMDGRVQLPVIEYLMKVYGVDYVDSVTEPGPVKYLSENTDKAVVEQVKLRISISVGKHGSKVIAVCGHEHCAGNPVDKAIQIGHIKDSIELIKTWGFGCEMLGLWINGDWVVEKVV
jgi:hypothetical protein